MRLVAVSIVVGLVVVGVVLWLHHHDIDGANASPPAGAARAASTPASRTREVQALVAERNRAADQERRAFEADGWSFVETAEPDPDLVAASPKLLATREAELRGQLASAPPGREHLANVKVIAATARDATTRVAAVEAIARMGKGEPQRALLDLLPQLDPNDPARRALLPLLRPENLTDPMVRALIALLDSPSVANDEKDQIAMTLAMLSLRDSGQELDVPMSTTARALIERMTRIALRAHAPARS